MAKWPGRNTTIDDLEVKEKTVIVRVDVNSPLDKKTLEISNAARIKAIEPTLRRLLDRKAKLVIIAHQSKKGRMGLLLFGKARGRPQPGAIKLDVRFVPDIFGDKAQAAVEFMNQEIQPVFEHVMHLHPNDPVAIAKHELQPGLALALPD